MAAPEPEIDDWGFTNADHSELQTLMKKHHERLLEMMLEVMEDGTTPMPDDPGLMGWIGRALPPTVSTRVFPKGGLWWGLLERLRALNGVDQRQVS